MQEVYLHAHAPYLFLPRGLKVPQLLRISEAGSAGVTYKYRRFGSSRLGREQASELLGSISRAAGHQN